MDSKERRSSAAPLLLALVVIVALLPLLYVAAIGPIAWMAAHDMVDVAEGSVVTTAYKPLEYLARQSEPVRGGLEWYMALWSPSLPAPLPQPSYSY